MKTPDWNDFKLGTSSSLDIMLKPYDFGFKRSRVRGTGSSFWTFGITFMSVRCMQLQSPNFVYKCTTGSYCMWIKNYARMLLMSQNIIPCEKIHPPLT